MSKRTRQFMLRISEEQFETLATIATERGLVGGTGTRGDAPNRAAAARALMAKADSRMKEG